MNVINDAKKGAVKDSAYAVITAAELEMTKKEFKTPTTYTEDDDLNYKGTKPDKMNLFINLNGKVKIDAFIGGYCVVKDYNEDEVTIDEDKKTEEECVKGLSFNTDSWLTIIENVKNKNTNYYNVGDTKEVDLAELGIHTLRIANMSSNDPVCSNSTYSETACGFVLEFADIITTHNMNSTNTNIGGWKVSEMRTYVNDTIYNALPDELKKGIIDTRVVSGHGSDDAENFTSIDKLYLLSSKEVWNGGTNYDTAEAETRQLDYYKGIEVTLDNYSGAIKKEGLQLIIGGYVQLILTVVTVSLGSMLAVVGMAIALMISMVYLQHFV